MTLHRSPFHSQSDSSSSNDLPHSMGDRPSTGSSASRRQSRRRRRRERNRRGLLESLEQRQLLAGPDLVGVQPNVGSLLFESPVQNVDPDGRISVINESPRELVFRFDEQTTLDPNTLSGIRITRAGEDRVFESATATTDLGTNGDVVLEFRAVQSGTSGNGIQVSLTSSNLATSAPVVSVNDRSVQITLSNTPGRVSRVQDLILAIEGNQAASNLIEVIQVTGPVLGTIGDNINGTQVLTLEGANAAGAITDLGTSGEMRLRLISQLPGEQGQGTEIVVERRNFGGPANPAVIVNGNRILIQVNSAPGNETTAGEFIDSINNNPNANALVKAVLQEGSLNTLIGNRSNSFSPLTLSGASDVVIEPGFVGFGDTAREVVFRFNEPLPDDLYQIDVLGTGASALTNIAGEPFQDGTSLSRQFRINLGPKVVAVVPEPVRRNPDNGQLLPQTGIIEVHFNDDDLSIGSATNPDFYQLFFTNGTANNNDGFQLAPINPNSVTYNSVTNIATLDFGVPLSRLINLPAGAEIPAVQLRVGTSDNLPAAPTEIDLTGAEPGDHLDGAFDLSSQWVIGTTGTQSARLTSTIDNETPYNITLPGPDLPGTRTIRPEDPSRLDRLVPLDYVRNAADSEEGISVIEYNFPASWQNPNPGPNEQITYTSIISEQQKERVREAFQLFSDYLGISFVEVEGDPASGSAISIVVGDLAGGGGGALSSEGDLAVVTADTNGDGIDDLGILDFQDFDESVDDQFGGEFFRGSMFIVGQLLGYGYADDLPQPTTQSTNFIFNPGTDNEPAFPSAADIVHGQYLYRPEGTDIDFYTFSLATRGDFTAETIAERAGTPSLLDTALRLYRVGTNGSFEEIAFNDDYFSNDSLIRINNLPAGDYALGVSAKGNTSYDPSTPGTGFGGRSEGDYELRVEFIPQSAPTIVDNTSAAQGGPVQLDGDGDGRPGGVFNFWFVPTSADTTLYVDKAAPIGGNGLVSTPFRSIRDAINAATPGDTIRIIGNGGLDGDIATVDDNFSYKIGFTNTGSELEDGSTLNLPQGVRMIIDSGAIIKLNRARVGVGSVFPVIDQSDAALQVLGTPSLIGANGLPARDETGSIIPGSVIFTSFNDDSVGGGNTTTFTPDPRPGDWGGIDFRGDLDAADESRRNREDEGVFLNHIQYADLRYGGGAVSIGNRQVVVSPIDMAITRPTIITSQISNSADAALAATPNTFAETRFTENIFQGDNPFTPDYTRVGPDIRDNTIIDNSINGLFIRVVTRTGDVLETISQAVRFDDTDVTHVLAENLVVEGTAGGPIRISSAPSSLLVRSLFTDVGDVPEGTYTYRITNVTAEGLESAASNITTPFTLAGTSDGFGGVQLSQLPTINPGTDFVSRRVYRATVPTGVDPETLTAADFRLVGQLNGSDTAFVDRASAGTVPLSGLGSTLQSRLDGSLKLDPGTILKLDGARIEARFGADIIAEGSSGLPVVITGLEDQRYGIGGTVDTNDRGPEGVLNPGDWGGIYIGQGASASIDHAVIAGGGGVTRIEGGFAEFNALEVHQANLRLTNSRFELNASGDGDNSGDRVGRGDNAPGSLFVRASQPIIANNQFIGGQGPAFSFDVNSLTNEEVTDHGRSTGVIERVSKPGNYGPLVQNNQVQGNAINGLQVRGGELVTAGVWDDTDIVHVVTDTIEIPNQHIFGGLRLQSDANASLVVKFADGDEPATIIAGGTVASGSEELKDIADRIGGALQIVGTPDFPVVLTSLFDSTVGAGFDVLGNPQLRTVSANFGNQASNLGRLSLIQPDPGVLATAIGPFGLSTDALGTTGTGDLQVEIPDGATVERAFLHVATRTFTDEFRPDLIGFGGVNVPLEYLNNIDDPQAPIAINFGLGFADVTSIVDGIVAGQTGIINIPVDENVTGDATQIEGTTLSVIYRDPTLSTRTILLLHGGLTSQQTNQLSFAEPIDTTAADFIAEMRLGISFSTAASTTPVQTSEVTVNGQLISSAAGGFDDGVLLDGQLITYGGVGDNPANPADPTDPTAADDEYYTLTPFLANGTQQITIGTQNPSQNDSIFLTSFVLSGEADVTPVGSSGDWTGIVIREAAHDRNVALINETESVGSPTINSNAIPSQSTFLGELAPNEESGDENRRLGFVVNGKIATRDDVDVFSFVAESGTEVWLDIDQTSNSLDSVVELIDANGVVLASSNDSALGVNPSGIFVSDAVNPETAQSLSLLSGSAEDDYSINAADAGMRVLLPGEVNTRNLYHVRVRSSNTQDPLDFATLVDPANVLGGLTQGGYQLQVRLSEANEVPGTQINFADIRFATNGVQIIGQPLHSPLVGEEFETTAANDSLATAQRLGYAGTNGDANAESGPLSSDRLAKSFAGSLDSLTDVDWYQFDITYEDITRANGESLHLSTVFDLDYADNFARADMAFYVFNSTGQLILVGGDSNIADDQPASTTNNGSTDLSRGSAGNNDPYIGATELIEGTYFIAISNQNNVPLPLDQFFNPNSANPLLRLEPIDSVTRIAEDRIGSSGGGTASAPVVPLLFDDNSIVQPTLDDVVLYVNTSGSLFAVNPLTGENLGLVGEFSDALAEVSFQANGELFAYSDFLPGDARSDTNWFYYRVNSGDATLSAPLSTGAGITTFSALRNPDGTFAIGSGNVGLDVEASTIAGFGGSERGYFVSNRSVDADTVAAGVDYLTNVLYSFDPNTGIAGGPNRVFNIFLDGDATSQQEVGQIDTSIPANPLSTFLGIQATTIIDANGVEVPALVDGDRFTIFDGTSSVVFEFDAGFTLNAAGVNPIRDGQTITVDGTVFELNTGQRIQLTAARPDGELTAGSTVRVEGPGGVEATFEFIRQGTATGTNIPLQIVDNSGQALSASAIAVLLADAINNEIAGLGAQADGDDVTFQSLGQRTLFATGLGVTIEGNNDVTPGAIAIEVSDTTSRETVTDRLADALRSQGIAAASAGTLITLPRALNVSTGPDVATNPFEVTGGSGASSGGQPILLSAGDTETTIAQRIASAVDAASDGGLLNNVSVSPSASGGSIRIINGVVDNVTSTNGALVAGGVRTGGLITGAELVTDVDGNTSLFAVDDAGGLYEVSEAELRRADSGILGPQQIGDYIETATDLIGINFSGLRSGPVSFNNGELRQILFGITADGDIHAFDTQGELQPIFAGGRTMISTGIAGAQGLDFSTLGFNLWHTTETRGTDAGHGIDPLDGGGRTAVEGGNSLAFTYEADAFNGNFPAVSERPTNVARQDGTAVQQTYNLPGGAKGSILSNEFSLEGYSAEDQPVLYFNYFLNTEDGDSATAATDTLRVYVTTPDGVSHLVATNNLATLPGTVNDEFDDPTTGIYADDIDVDVQPLFDNTGSWRQARVSLGEFAGLADLSLRIDFATAGRSDTSTPALRITSGSSITAGSELIIGNETFTLELEPSVTVPSGVELSNLYADPNAVAVVTVDGQDFVLNDGARPIAAGQTSVDLTAVIPAGLTLADLTAGQISLQLAEAIRLNAPPPAVVGGLSFSDAFDNGVLTAGRNDLIFEATALPYNGGTVSLEGTGRLGNVDNTGSTIAADDVDLLRLEVEPGTRLTADFAFDTNASIPLSIRFFDADGNPLISTTNADGNPELVSTDGGVVFVGISGPENSGYDIRLEGTTTNAQVGTYSGMLIVEPDRTVLNDDALVELRGFESVAANPANLFLVSDAAAGGDLPIRISRSMTASEVAAAVQQAVANRFTDGNLSLVPRTGASLRLPGLTVQDDGPFTNEGERYGQQYGGGVVAGTNNNNFEGVYLDDFIIGFAERGENATSSNVVNTPFVTGAFTTSANLPVTGSYQVEIRDGSEYADTTAGGTRFRTFDTNDRLASSTSITAKPAGELRDGQFFSITDGRNEVFFEFDTDGSVTPGRVQVPFSLRFTVPGTEQIDPTTGLPIPGTELVRPNTASEVADSIIAAINRPDVQAVLNLTALPSSGVDATSDPRIDLFGDVIINDLTGALADVSSAQRRGDANRDRGGQGVILIENSSILFNSEFGIDINHNTTATIGGVTSDTVVRYPRNLVEQNTEGLVPGVVVRSNVLAYNNTGGLQITGIADGGDTTQTPPVPFDRIVNNTIVGGTVTAGGTGAATVFNEVLFPNGDISFADAVTVYNPNAGGFPPTAVNRIAGNTLGAPDETAPEAEPAAGEFTASLGVGGTLTVQFTDNFLTGSDNAQPDLVIFETGAVESVLVEVSRDGITFVQVGIAGGVENKIDIDAAGFTSSDRLSFVRLTDLRQGAVDVDTLGADIDAVGAISTVPAEQFTSGGTGVNLVGNVAPTVINNVIANANEGIAVSGNNTNAALLSDAIILGGNAFYRNTTDTNSTLGLGQFPLQLSDSEAVFVGASDLVFSPAANSRIIDSSIDSLEDRPSLVTVKNPIGLPPSPILAPRLDVNGQLRVDDPDVETPSGLGERVFKDRGAADRGDLSGPRAVLISPQAPGLGTGAGVVSVFGQAPSVFEVQLVDGLAPADVVPGTGIDDRTVNSGSVILLRDGEALVEGVDYRFGYNPSTNVIRLTPLAGVWQQDSTYTIRLVDGRDSLIRTVPGTQYTDGGQITVGDQNANAATFEYELGTTIRVDQTLPYASFEGLVVTVFDGAVETQFELDINGSSTSGRVRVALPVTGDADDVAAALAAAIDAQTGFTVNFADNVVQLLGGTPLANVTVDAALGTTQGGFGVSPGFGIQIPANGTQVAASITDGAIFTIQRDNATSVTFEFDDNGSVNTADAIPVTIFDGASLDDVADAMVRAIGGSILGLTPDNAGFGRVAFGGDVNLIMTFGDTGLTQIAQPGSNAATPIVIPVNLTDAQISQRIADAINNQNLAGVSASAIANVVFVEGTTGITGDGAIDTTTIRDDVGNALQSNLPNGRTELTIFIGGGFDYGDAPAPYSSLLAAGGPRHAINPNFRLGATVSPDADAQLPDNDVDDGITSPGVVRGGFTANFGVNIFTDGEPFYLDAWFDWNADGVFETVQRFGSAGTGRAVLAEGNNTITVTVPSGATPGESYARFRLSDDAALGSTGDAISVSGGAGVGEVEDIRLIVSSNPFQNPLGQYDVNASGAVTPLDALQIINMLRRANTGSIQLQPNDVLGGPALFPDVDANGRVTANDALLVINELNRQALANEANAEGESAAAVYQPVASGVMASGATVIGDELIAEADAEANGTVDNPPTKVSSTSVFDEAAVVALDDVVDTIADDAAAQSSEDEVHSVDQAMSELGF